MINMALWRDIPTDKATILRRWLEDATDSMVAHPKLWNPHAMPHAHPWPCIGRVWARQPAPINAVRTINRTSTIWHKLEGCLFTYTESFRPKSVLAPKRGIAGRCLEHAAKLGAWGTAAKAKSGKKRMAPGLGPAKSRELVLPNPKFKLLVQLRAV